jgi:hypothetical protein
LAWEASGEDINSSRVSCRVELFDVSELFCIGEVVLEDFARELFPLAIEDVSEP